MTFFPYGGYVILQPEEWDRKIGDMIELNNTNAGGYNYNLIWFDHSCCFLTELFFGEAA